MRKVIVTVFVLTCISFLSRGQQGQFNGERDSLQAAVSSNIIIKGEEIRRFPSGNLLEAINGMFPWIFSNYVKGDEFNFIVNGFLLMDINSISLNDIDEIVFSRTASNGSLFPFSKVGTFYIKTIAPKNKIGISFNSQYNTTWHPEEGEVISSQGIRTSIITGKPGHYISNHLSVSSKGKKAGIYFSAQMNQYKTPALDDYQEYGLLRDTLRRSSSGRMPDQRFYGNFTYRFSGKVNAGITASYSHARPGSDTTLSEYTFSTKVEGKVHMRSRLNYYDAGFFLEYKPSSRLTNTFWFEYAYDTITTLRGGHSDYVNSGAPPAWVSDSMRVNPESKRYTFRDVLRYQLVQRNKMAASLSLTSIYLRQDAQDNRVTWRNYSAGGPGVSGSWYLIKEKIGAINPAIDFSWRKLVSAYAGSSFLIGEKVFKDVIKKDKIALYGGMTIDFARLMKNGKAPGEFSFSVDYSDQPQNNSNNQWMGGTFDPYSSAPHYILSAYVQGYDPLRLHILSNQLVSASIRASTTSRRLLFIAEWSRLVQDKVYIINPGPWSIPAFLLRDEITEGLSFAFDGRLVDQPKLKWRTRLNALFPTIKRDEPLFYPSEPLHKSLVRAGLQNNLEYRNFFFGLNIITDINHKYQTTTLGRTSSTEHDDFVINHILTGFRLLNTGNGFFRQIDVYAQARNLVISKKPVRDFADDRFAGVGVNVSF